MEEQQAEGLEGIRSEEGMCERGATHTLDRLQRQIISILRPPAELGVTFATQITATAFLTELAAGKVDNPGESRHFRPGKSFSGDVETSETRSCSPNVV